VETAQPTVSSQPAARRRARLSRSIGTGLIVVGSLVLAWAIVVWIWNDPFTGLYTRWQQRHLTSTYAHIVETYRPVAQPPKASPAREQAIIGREAALYRAHAATGTPIGRIIVPRLGLNMILVNGTDHDSLTKGPGRDERTYMPGQHELVYIAGHRTTYLAPFAHIDAMRPGDRITLEMPYATFVYSVTGHVIVDAHDLAVLRSHHREVVALQACHPRFFATHRYIVWAKPIRVIPRRGKPYIPTAGQLRSAA
jgi:sortase A